MPYPASFSADTAGISTVESSGTTEAANLQNAVVTAVNDAWTRRDMVIPVLQENIRSILCEDTGNLLEEVDLEIKEK